MHDTNRTPRRQRPGPGAGASLYTGKTTQPALPMRPAIIGPAQRATIHSFVPDPPVRDNHSRACGSRQPDIHSLNIYTLNIYMLDTGPAS